jgi:hypothetical protein
VSCRWWASTDTFGLEKLGSIEMLSQLMPAGVDVPLIRVNTGVPDTFGGDTQANVVAMF